MSFFKFFSPVSYWLLIILWFFIFVFYLRRIIAGKLESKLFTTLLIILAIDAFRSLFESIYFGAWYTSLVGFIPKSIHDTLVRPEYVFIPKFFNVIAAILIIFIVLRHWIPGEEAEREREASYLKELEKEVERRKESEKKLHQFKFTLDQTVDCVFMFSPETLKFFYVNRGAINQLGFKEEEFYRMTPLDIKPEFTEDTFRQTLKPLFDDRKKAHLFETVHQHKNGSLIPVEIFLQLVKQPTEEGGRFLAIVRDITERKRSRQQLQKVMDTMEAIIYVADMESCEILLINKYTKKRFGNITGQRCWEAIQGQSGPCSFCEFYNLRHAGQPVKGVHVWQVQNTTDYQWYECRDQEILWVDGRIARLQVATNITERKKIEDEREQLIEQLRKALSEIQVLRGILPICSFCKNIRNDKGYYEQIESYIHKHSGIDFSHTICPACFKKHYPEEYEAVSREKDRES